MRDVLGWLNEISGCLAETSETAFLDANSLVARCMSKPLSWVIAHPEAVPSAAQEEQMAAAIAHLKQGMPLPYVLGEWEFYGLRFQVTPDVLIPRPETELLVGQALTWLEDHPHRRLALDVGTGSGCIAIALALNCPGLRVIATDRSLQALRIARLNAIQHQVASQIEFIQADLIGPFITNAFRSLGLVLANLPYIPSQSLRALAIYRREPSLALDGGHDGLELIRSFLKQAGQIYSDYRVRNDPASMILLEIEARQGGAVSSFANSVFPTADVQLLQDLAGHDRLVRILLA